MASKTLTFERVLQESVGPLPVFHTFDDPTKTIHRERWVAEFNLSALGDGTPPWEPTIFVTFNARNPRSEHAPSFSESWVTDPGHAFNPATAWTHELPHGLDGGTLSSETVFHDAAGNVVPEIGADHPHSRADVLVAADHRQVTGPIYGWWRGDDMLFTFIIEGYGKVGPGGNVFDLPITGKVEYTSRVLPMIEMGDAGPGMVRKATRVVGGGDVSGESALAVPVEDLPIGGTIELGNGGAGVRRS